LEGGGDVVSGKEERFDFKAVMCLWQKIVGSGLRVLKGEMFGHGRAKLKNIILYTFLIITN
jgi:hypothetical protein